MATGTSIADAFKLFATKAEKREATSKDVTKWCTDAGGIFGKNCSSNNLDIAFHKIKTKGKTTITVDKVDALVKELAKAYSKDSKLSEEEALVQLKNKLSEAKPKAHGATKTSKTGGVANMTDTSKYTGAHKERFDADGKGKGVDGREDRPDNSGYVGNYKGEGTHGKK